MAWRGPCVSDCEGGARTATQRPWTAFSYHLRPPFEVPPGILQGREQVRVAGPETMRRRAHHTAIDCCMLGSKHFVRNICERRVGLRTAWRRARRPSHTRLAADGDVQRWRSRMRTLIRVRRGVGCRWASWTSGCIRC